VQNVPWVQVETARLKWRLPAQVETAKVQVETASEQPLDTLCAKPRKKVMFLAKYSLDRIPFL
jgi:hypothetical protein